MFLEYQSYMPAFAPRMSKLDSADISKKCDNHYTVQLCRIHHRIKDPFFQGNHKIQIIQMGELYRYIFSSYASLLKAQKNLIWMDSTNISHSLYPKIQRWKIRFSHKY